MVIQIDTDSKTITVDEDVKLGLFYDKVRNLLPETWMSFSLKQKYNLVVERPVYTPKPSETEHPWVYYTHGVPVTCYNSGVYNIEIK